MWHLLHVSHTNIGINLKSSKMIFDYKEPILGNVAENKFPIDPKCLAANLMGVKTLSFS